MPLFKKLALTWHVGRGLFHVGTAPGPWPCTERRAPSVTFSILGARYHALSDASSALIVPLPPLKAYAALASDVALRDALYAALQSPEFIKGR